MVLNFMVTLSLLAPTVFSVARLQIIWKIFNVYKRECKWCLRSFRLKCLKALVLPQLHLFCSIDQYCNISAQGLQIFCLVANHKFSKLVGHKVFKLCGRFFYLLLRLFNLTVKLQGLVESGSISCWGKFSVESKWSNFNQWNYFI